MSDETFTITTEQLVNALPVLTGTEPQKNKEGKETIPTFFGLFNYGVNAATGRKFSKLIKILVPEYKDFEEQRVKLCERLGTKNEETGLYDIDKERKSEFDTEFKALLDDPITIPNDLKIKVEHLKTPLSLKEALELKTTSIEIPMTRTEIELLSWLIED
jgi:hypothetical protein